MKKNKIYSSLFYSIINNCFNRKYQSNSYVPFDLKYAIEVITEFRSILAKEPSVLLLNSETTKNIVVVGDIHGSIESLAKIFLELGYPPEKKYLFLGDYVDRGEHSCEVIILLYVLKCMYKDDIFLIRGNHEFGNMTENYGFKNECLRKFRSSNGDREGEIFYQEIIDSFPYLPICAIVNNSIFCVHGGITALIDDRDQLLKIQKVGHFFKYEDSAQAELLWNDPTNDFSHYAPSSRGIGCVFGEEALKIFLKKMDIKFVIRAHQDEMLGYRYPIDEDERLLTIFSSLDYCGTFNDAAVAIISSDDKKPITIHTISVYSRKPRLIVPNKIIEEEKNIILYKEFEDINPLDSEFEGIKLLID
ncbi:hypothetical protein M9Y10_044296 [Tritrichomonas musculus]|uniref:Serine/threonine-protein phosphatase n=1 Tax=Tritrichomonas musculus TaxID=1915356 RepID=A0ABR2K3V2_9EUKA